MSLDYSPHSISKKVSICVCVGKRNMRQMRQRKRSIREPWCSAPVHLGHADGSTSTCPSCSSTLCRVMSCPIARATRSASCTMPATGRRPPSLPLCGEASAIGQFPGATVPIHARGRFCRGIWRSKFRFARGPLGERAKGSNPSDSLVALHGRLSDAYTKLPGR